MIAVVQPHRYTRLRDLFDEFCTCFNDADTVIVAPVYAAGEAPIEGIDRDTWSRACASAAIATPGRCRDRRRSAGMIARARASPATTSSASAPARSPMGLRAAGRTGEARQ